MQYFYIKNIIQRQIQKVLFSFPPFAIFQIQRQTVSKTLHSHSLSSSAVCVSKYSSAVLEKEIFSGFVFDGQHHHQSSSDHQPQKLLSTQLGHFSTIPQNILNNTSEYYTERSEYYLEHLGILFIFKAPFHIPIEYQNFQTFFLLCSLHIFCICTSYSNQTSILRVGMQFIEHCLSNVIECSPRQQNIMDCFSAGINLSSCSIFLPGEGKYLEGKSICRQCGKSQAGQEEHLSVMVLFATAQ